MDSNGPTSVRDYLPSRNIPYIRLEPLPKRRVFPTGATSVVFLLFSRRAYTYTYIRIYTQLGREAS